MITDNKCDLFLKKDNKCDLDVPIKFVSGY